MNQTEFHLVQNQKETVSTIEFLPIQSKCYSATRFFGTCSSEIKQVPYIPRRIYVYILCTARNTCMVVGEFRLGRFHLEKFHRENSTYGKFHQRKIPHMENSTQLWKIPHLDSSTDGQIGHISKTKNLKINFSFNSAHSASCM